MASITADLLTQTTSTTRATPTTVTTVRSISGTTLQCAALTGWPTGTAVHFVTYQVDTSGNKLGSTQVDWKGIVSGTTITQLTVKGGTDNGNSIGDIVEAAPTFGWSNDVYTWGFKNHDTTGNHKDLTASNAKTVLGLTDGAATVNNLRVTSANTLAKPSLTAEGTDTNVDMSIAGKGTGRVYIDGAAPQPYFALYDFIESGCIWTADSVGVTRAASMSAGVVWIGGKRLTVAAVTGRLFTGSRDTYVDFSDSGSGTASITYTEAANNAASTSLSGLRNAIIVTAAGSIATTGSINQGQESALLPIVSSIPYAVTDSLGNLICPRDPNRKLLGYRQISADFTTTSATKAQITGLSVPVVIPSGRKIKVIASGGIKNGTSGNGVDWSLWDGVVGVGTEIINRGLDVPGANFRTTAYLEAVVTPATTSKTYNMATSSGGGVATTTVLGATSALAFIKVELA
jgi:hypothetical protein